MKISDFTCKKVVMVRKSRASVDIIYRWSLTYVGVGESVRCHFGVADGSLDHGPRADVLS